MKSLFCACGSLVMPVHRKHYILGNGNGKVFMETLNRLALLELAYFQYGITHGDKNSVTLVPFVTVTSFFSWNNSALSGV